MSEKFCTFALQKFTNTRTDEYGTGNARLDEAERDIDEGRLFATEEVFHPEYAKAI